MPADRPRTESDQWAALSKIKKGGSVNKGEMTAFRRDATTRTGWNTKRFDAWIARMASAGHLRTPITATAEKREAMLEGTLEGPEAEQAAMMRRVRTYMAANTEGHASASHVNTMRANLRGRTRSKMGVEAALAILEHSGEITLEDRVQGRGGHGRNMWRQEAMTWARERQWTCPSGTLSQQAPLHRETLVVEFGTGWEGATEGLKGVFDRVISMDAERQTLKAEGGKPTLQSVPDLLGRFQDAAAHPGGAAAWAVQRSGGLQGELAAIWGSPSCVEGSGAQAINKGKEGGAGPHAGMPFSAVHDDGVNALLEGITKARLADPTVQYCIEQPATSAMKDMPEVRRTLGEGVKVYGCAWGERKSLKPYRLWLSPATAEIFHPIHPSSPLSRCEECKAGVVHTQAMMPAAGSTQERVRLPGMTVGAARNRVPPRLAEHVGLAMRTACITAREARKGSS
jgi:hypothetical protein